MPDDDARPVRLELKDADHLLIEWSDGKQLIYAVRELRENCPCATCREERRAAPKPEPLLPVISQQEAQPPRIKQMRPVGSYAYGITFADGHDTGIFTFEHLRAMGRPAE